MSWKALRHQNALPLLGVMMKNREFVMVSQWMDNGNINEFIETHGNANRFKLVGFCSTIDCTCPDEIVSSDSLQTLLED